MRRPIPRPRPSPTWAATLPETATQAPTCMPSRRERRRSEPHRLRPKMLSGTVRSYGLRLHVSRDTPHTGVAFARLSWEDSSTLGVEMRYTTFIN
eukprot:1460870-Prymnesium_polylepis.2